VKSICLHVFWTDFIVHGEIIHNHRWGVGLGPKFAQTNVVEGNHKTNIGNALDVFAFVGPDGAAKKKNPNCYNVCKGGEVKFDWQRNEKACEDDPTENCPPEALNKLMQITKLQRFAAHNVFEVSKKGYETCKMDDFEFNKGKYIGGWDDPDRKKTFGMAPNKGTKDNNGKFLILKNMQPPKKGEGRFCQFESLWLR
jgi:hypothetical protein